MQPGSSVATALSEGESKRKNVVMLEVRGNQWRTIKYPLDTVRPFAFDNVSLSSQEGLDPEDPKVRGGGGGGAGAAGTGGISQPLQLQIHPFQNPLLLTSFSTTTTTPRRPSPRSSRPRWAL